MFSELSKAEAAYKKKLRDFSCFAPPYDRHTGKAFDWCNELEKHLSRNECDMIPNEVIKMMLLDCIVGKKQSEIVLLRPDGLAFENYEIRCQVPEMMMMMYYLLRYSWTDANYGSQHHIYIPNIYIYIFGIYK